jgi:transposase
MTSLDTIINESKDAREVKRALSVKMTQKGMPTAQISTLLNVSLQYISKWKMAYASEGAESLSIHYQGKPSYLSQEQKQEIFQWIAQYETLKIEDLIAHIDETYHILFRSKQSYYTL